ncbi:nucleotide-binding protein [Bradyrhizobium ontarionense]|uniref:Nucleotide-binding protein n=1 Tax=Bradyrhizobium ontarionense TaxID=2898149 RepID=A0ABY3RFP0_9BRAD|nr:nucleotide-binding protein [Bradyrhizobium sp. A19]UFZ06126.1 nucleotide-binding protein [Bradyrhizobium sp. A19]
MNDLDVSTISSGTDLLVIQIEKRIASTLANVFGERSEQYARLISAAHLDHTSYTLDFGFGELISTPAHEIQKGIDSGRQIAVATLQGEVDSLKEHLEFASIDQTSSISGLVTPGNPNKEVFIVHGRDEAAKEAVARVVERAGLKPIILHEQPNNGKTVIEKFEKHGAAAGFAVVIATPDDVGGLAVAPPTEPRLFPRARQNVIGEMFWFAGRLGREKVCALVKGDVDMPSDFAGLIYTSMDDHGGWKSKLLQELNAAGYSDLNWAAALA